MWTGVDDIKNRWLLTKPLPEETKLEVFIGDVEAQLTERWPNIEEKIAEKPEVEDAIKRLVANVIIEYLQTEGTAAQFESQAYSAVGNASISYRSKARYSLTLTDDDFSKVPIKGETGNVKILVFERHKPLSIHKYNKDRW